MNQNDPSNLSRRELGRRVGQIAAASALAGLVVPNVHAAESSTIQVALVGCGGRGTGAAMDALRVRGTRTKLVAMADAFQDRIERSYDAFTEQDEFGPERLDVPKDRQFVGFDAYKGAMDCLKPGDIAIFATPLAFRWVHFAYAIRKGLHVFMEKPLSADGPQSRKLLKLGEEATAKNLKVGVGLMSRHHRPLQELHQRISDGAIGDILLMRGYRMHGATGSIRSRPRNAPRLPRPGGGGGGGGGFGRPRRTWTEVEYQVRRFHSFLWASGGSFSDFNIHIIDHLCWMKNAWPVKALGVGGRHFKQDEDGTPFVDQNFDSYGIEYTFDDGAKLLFDGRTVQGAGTHYYSALQGTKGSAIASARGDCGAPSSLYKGWKSSEEDMIWRSTDQSQPYQNEWNDLLDAIVNDKPYNEVKRGVEASLVTSMGRMAAHIGQEVTFDQMLNSDHEFAPDVDKLTLDGPAPLTPDANGAYPRPEPGKKKREY